MIKVLELKGYKSYKAVLTYNKLLLGLMMLPTYRGVQYEEFYTAVREKSEEDQKKILREAAMFVDLQQDEIEALVCFCTDANGVPYQAANMKNLGPDQLIDVIISVCFEISKIKIDMVTEAEKKN